MRLTLLLLVVTLPLAAQETAPEPALGASTYEFRCEQGWNLLTTVDSWTTATAPALFPPVTAPDLTEGAGTVRIAGQGGSDKLTNSERSRWQVAATMPPPPQPVRDLSSDPVKMKGSVTILPDGTPIFRFEELRYWDLSQTWTIQFRGGTVKARNVGGGSGDFTGSIGEWPPHCRRLQQACMRAILKIAAPQEAKVEKGVPTPGAKFDLDVVRRVYVFHALEEQYVVLMLSRLNGVPLTEDVWEGLEKDCSPRTVGLARQMVGRMIAQCRGTLAPGGELSVEEARWNFDREAVPHFTWEQYGLEDHRKAVEESRGRIAALIKESHRGETGITRDRWVNALTDELRALNRFVRPHDPAEGNSSAGDLRLPSVAKPGAGAFRYRETQKKNADGIRSSRVYAAGVASEMVLFVFESKVNRYLPALVDMKTWYRGDIRRK